jgi:putative ABC transport system substrate-binding protein
MQRREFITLFGGAAVSVPFAARAQQPAGRVYRVGYFAFGSREQGIHLINAFEEGLRSLGYRVGENVVIEYRFANRQLERLPALTAELVRLGVDVIVTGAHQNTVAAMEGDHDHPDRHDQRCRSGRCRACRQSGATGRQRHRVRRGRGRRDFRQAA